MVLYCLHVVVLIMLKNNIVSIRSRVKLVFFSQHWANNYTSFGSDFSWVPGLSVREARPRHPHRYELLRRGSSRGQPCLQFIYPKINVKKTLKWSPCFFVGICSQRRGTRPPRFPWLHVYRPGDNLRESWQSRGSLWLHHPDPHPHHA